MNLQVSRSIVAKLKAKISFFSNFVEEEILELIRLASHREYHKGDVIFKENSDGNEMYIILAGEVKITKLSDEKMVIILANLTAGDCFGEMSLIDGSKRSAQAAADSDVNVMILKEEVLKQNLSIAYKLFRNFSVMMANRLRITNKNYLETSADETKHRERFTEILKKHAERGGSFDGSNLRDSRLTNVSFTNSTLKNANLVHTKFEGCKMNSSDYGNSMLVGAEFKNAIFTDCSFYSANFSAVKLSNVVFKDCSFQQSAFKQLIAKGVTVTRAKTLP